MTAKDLPEFPADLAKIHNEIKAMRELAKIKTPKVKRLPKRKGNTMHSLQNRELN